MGEVPGFSEIRRFNPVCPGKECANIREARLDPTCLLRDRAWSRCSCPPEDFLRVFEVHINELRPVCLPRAFQSHSIGRQVRMKSKPGSSKRQDCKFEIVVNHITINEDLLPQGSQQSVAALKNVFGHKIKK